MKASVKVVDNGDRIEGIASYGNWMESCVISLIRHNGTWVIGTSITMPSKIDDAKIVFDAFRLAFNKADELSGIGIDSFDYFDLFDEFTNENLISWLKSRGIRKPSQMVQKIFIPDFERQCAVLTNNQKESVVQWMKNKGFGMIPF